MVSALKKHTTAAIRIAAAAAAAVCMVNGYAARTLFVPAEATAAAHTGTAQELRVQTEAVSIAHTGTAQEPYMPSASLVTAKAYTSLSKFHPGSSGYLAVTADIEPGWHINSNKPLDRYLIPTVLEVSVPDGIDVVRILYPEPSLEKLEISEGEMSLYQGSVSFGALIRIGTETPPGTYTITATLHYQGCNNLSCVEPAYVTVDTELAVGTMSEAVEQMHTGIFSRPPFTGWTDRAAGAFETGDEGESIVALIERRGLFLSFLFIFITGLALNLTPCIYPIIPITVSYFGGQAGGRPGRVLALALIYVLGMSVTYSILGVVAAMTGSLFGSVLQNPWVISFIVAVMAALAASMFGLWEIRMPTFIARRTGTARQGYAGALLMGLTVGFVAAPCIGPFILGLLTYVGEMGRPVLGFLMFFTLAWGMGVPFIVLGTASGSISRLPRSGDWMVWVKKIFGFVLIAMALYFARHLIGGRSASVGYALTAAVAGLYLGWIDRTGGGRGFMAVKKTITAAALAAAVIILVAPGGPLRTAAPAEGIAWEPFAEEKLVKAARARIPVMIDFTADWCVPCHELDRKSFSDPAVIDLSRRIVPLRVDLTRSGEREDLIKKRFNIRGVPTIIFIDGSGRELSDIRVSGFVGPGEIRRYLGRLFEDR